MSEITSKISEVLRYNFRYNLVVQTLNEHMTGWSLCWNGIAYSLYARLIPAMRNQMRTNDHCYAIICISAIFVEIYKYGRKLLNMLSLLSSPNDSIRIQHDIV